MENDLLTIYPYFVRFIHCYRCVRQPFRRMYPRGRRELCASNKHIQTRPLAELYELNLLAEEICDMCCLLVIIPVSKSAVSRRTPFYCFRDRCDMPGKCSFQGRWVSNPLYSQWIARVATSSGDASCRVCQKSFDVSNMGEAALRSHMRAKRHASAMLGTN